MTTTIPAYTFGGITRPALILDDQGQIVLFGAAAQFAATYGLKALYAGVPPGTPYPPVTDSLSTPIQSPIRTSRSHILTSTTIQTKACATKNCQSSQFSIILRLPPVRTMPVICSRTSSRPWSIATTAVYSYLKAVFGSTFIARLAGT